MIEEREKEILELLTKYSTLSFDELQYFDQVILTEIILNVTEHGVSHIDKGWWMLCQYHKKSKFISICIADNGIGFRNHLMNGPQNEYLLQKFDNNYKNDGKIIKIALQDNISGASEAPIKTGKIIKKYPRGTKRGHGLKIISEYCIKLKIPFSILSQNGFLFLDHEGNEIKCGYRKKRVFAGTLFHFRVKAK